MQEDSLLKGQTMFLHLVDDEKFIDSAIEIFNKVDPGNHEYILLMSPNKEFTFRHIKQKNKIVLVGYNTDLYRKYIDSISNYSAVFLHSMISPFNISFVLDAPEYPFFVWIFWGGEFWRLQEYRLACMLPATRRLYYYNSISKWLKINFHKYNNGLRGGRIKDIAQSVFQKHLLKAENKQVGRFDLKQAFYRIRYIIPVIQDDGEHLRKRFSLDAELLDWNYSPGISFDDIRHFSVNGNNILVGNSAHYSNNHIDMFKLLRKKRISFNKCIVPLSYGDEEYRKSILKTGSQLLGSQFQPLTEFMPIGEYLQIISSCSCAFFNMRRQQAMGNIGLMLLLGARVYLREENPIFSFLRRKGIDVFSIVRDMRFCKTDASGYPSVENVRQRWKILFSLYSESAMAEKTCNMLNFLKEKKL